MEAAAARRYARSVSMEPQFADLLPELVLGIGPDRLAALAVKALTPRPTPTVSIAHVHEMRVSVREHANILRDRLVRAKVATFRSLCADCANTLEVVARFLALLELYRENLIGFDQVQALGELTVRWTAEDDAGATFSVDEYAGTPAEPAQDDDAQPVAGNPR
jgi:segregation and condensation protein A